MNLVKKSTSLAQFSTEQIDLIKSTIMSSGKDSPPPSDNDLALFGMICQQTGLSPFSKQIFAIQRKGQWTFQVSVDGLRAIADRTGQYAGSDEPLFDEGLDIFAFEASGRTTPTVCKVTVWKMINGQRCPFVGVARYKEFVQLYNGKPSDTWAKMPTTMLAKCAESQALRKAFPQTGQIEKSVENLEPMEAVEVINTEDDSWRISGYEWGINQGVSPEMATQIIQIASSKENLYQRMKSAIPQNAT